MGLSINIRHWTWVVLAGGIALFLVSWILFCRFANIPPAGPFIYTLTGLRDRLPGGSGFSLKSWIGQFGTLALWFGSLSIVWILAGVIRIRGYLTNKEPLAVDLFYISGLCLTIAASMIGVTFGFPKYHLPGAVLLTMAAVVILKEDLKPFWVLVSAIATGFILQMNVLGDKLYFFRYQLRSIQAGELNNIDGQGMWKWLIAGIAFFTAAFILRRSGFRSWIAVIVGLTLGMNAALSLIQTEAHYDTGYNYGGSGTYSVGIFVRNNVSGGKRIIATDEILYYAGRSGCEYFPNSAWSNIKELAVLLADKKTGALILSIVSNSVSQIKGIKHDPVLMDILLRQYHYQRIGTYDVWIRREG